MRTTLYWLLALLMVGIAMYKTGRGSVGDERDAVIAARQHVAIQQELLDSEFSRCGR